MDLVSHLEKYLGFLEPASIIILLIRLTTQRLVFVYRAFTIYLLIWFCQDVVPLVFGFNLGGNYYARFFFLSEPLAWVFSCLTLLELFDLTFTDFPGIRSAGKLILSAAILSSTVVATLTAIPSLVHVHEVEW